MKADGHGVESTCHVLREQGVQVAPRSYRAWKRRTPAERVPTDAAIVDVFHQLRQRDEKGRQSPEVLYGRRKMTAWLRRQGFAGMSNHTVDRLMRDEGMNGLIRGRAVRTTIPAKDGTRSGDLLGRDFSAPWPNHTWVTDFIYVPTWASFVYVAFAIELFSRMILGWHVSTVKDTAFVEACLRMALWRRDHPGRAVEPGMIHHSDAGSQYTSIRFTETVALEGLDASIGSVGDAYDNAAAETVMGLFKNEAIRKDSPFRTGPLRTLDDVEQITFDWVRWCNNQRHHSYLGDIPAAEHEPNHYAQNSGSSTGDAANKTAA
jgi:putative transposase